MKTITVMALALLALNATATVSYYPDTIVAKFTNQKTTKTDLRTALFDLSNLVHLKSDVGNDTLSETCPEEGSCSLQRQDMTYEEARKIMFGDLFLESRGNNKYSLKEVYCNITVDQSQGVGPNKIPNPNVINCEHTWPQSKFSKAFPAELQKTDLHHLFPVDMKANSTRSNNPFAEVEGKITHSNCQDSMIGNAIGTSIRSFEPPIEHRGNVARAIYYFSTRYKMNIDATQAKYLKKWNAEDPVDEAEMERNEKIMQLQGNRNPFVDYPELVNRL